MNMIIRGLVVGLALIGAGAAQAQSKTFSCGDIPNPKDVPKIEPIFRGNAGLNNSSFDCMAWQDFIFFNWPALPASRGLPNPVAKFGGAGPTVWETYRTTDTVFLPNAQNPGPWSQPILPATLQSSLAKRVGDGDLRHLTHTSKISVATLAHLLGGKTGMSETVLDEIAQAGGGTLYDLNGNPVYYEVAMDRMQYEYIVSNSLYNAATQATFAQTNVISLPAKPDGSEASVEVKAAWKILAGSDNKARFHTIQAVIGNSTVPVTVGLVGFHVFIANGAQGGWATFAQIDNAPVQTPATSGTFNFFNPACQQGGGACPINVKDANPGQVVQITPDDPTADQLNAYMHTLLKSYDKDTPWQYYNLVNVQWATNPVALASLTAPQNAPLPDGKPNTPTLVNAVLETFEQKPGLGCFSCHQYATTAGKTSYAASYSFAFGLATTPTVVVPPK